MDDKKIIKGSIPTNILGITMNDRPIGIPIFTSNFLKNLFPQKDSLLIPRL